MSNLAASASVSSVPGLDVGTNSETSAAAAEDDEEEDENDDDEYDDERSSCLDRFLLLLGEKSAPARVW